MLTILKPNCRIIDLDEVTEGAACTTLLAKKYIDNDKLDYRKFRSIYKWNSSKSLYNYSKNMMVLY